MASWTRGFAGKHFAASLSVMSIFSAIQTTCVGNEANTLTAVVKDLCDKEVVLLGEPAHHGSGRSIEFKAALVQHLVDECHFGAFFIESGVYDFLRIERRLEAKEPINEKMIGAAVGKIWSTTSEFQPLVNFLAARASTGRLKLGGIDDQLSSTAVFAQNEMPDELSSYLVQESRDACLARLVRHTHWQYADQQPYSVADRDALLQCVAQIQELARADGDGHQRSHDAEDAQMARALEHMLSRDFASETRSSLYMTRERSMFENFSWLKSRLAPGTKVIVWGATVHIAHGNASSDGDGSINLRFGNYVSEHERGVFALGFSALGGTYGRRQSIALPATPKESLESHALTDPQLQDRYLSKSQLQLFGQVRGRVLNESLELANWAKTIDGLVIFREDQPPMFLE